MTAVKPDEAVRLLIVEVIVQAFTDYKYLKERGIVDGNRVMLDRTGTKRLGKFLRKCEVIEIIEFLHGENLRMALRAAGSEVAQEAILYRMRQYCTVDPSKQAHIPPPPVVTSAANRSANLKLMAIYEAAKTGKTANVEAIKTNPESQQTYSRKAHRYKLLVLQAMA